MIDSEKPIVRLYHKITYWLVIAIVLGVALLVFSQELLFVTNVAQTNVEAGREIKPELAVGFAIVVALAVFSIRGSRFSYWTIATAILLLNVGPALFSLVQSGAFGVVDTSVFVIGSTLLVTFLLPGTRAYAFQHLNLFSSQRGI